MWEGPGKPGRARELASPQQLTFNAEKHFLLSHTDLGVCVCVSVCVRDRERERQKVPDRIWILQSRVSRLFSPIQGLVQNADSKSRCLIRIS